MPPPTTATTPAGRRLDLVALAADACRAYKQEFVDEGQRYGQAGEEWCVHDNQHVLNWAVLSLAGEVDFEEQIAWLGRILEARDFPLERLARSLELLCATVRRVHPEDPELADRIESGAKLVRSRQSFL
jgi:hypothetical protein